MDYVDLVQHVQELNDIELAMLLSMVAQKHCMLEAEQHLLDMLELEIKSV